MPYVGIDCLKRYTQVYAIDEKAPHPFLWLTASNRTGRSKRESARYKPESEREGNPEQQKGKYDPVFNGELRRDSIAVVELGARSVRHIHRIIEGIDGSLRVQRIFKEKAHLRTSLKMDEG